MFGHLDLRLDQYRILIIQLNLRAGSMKRIVRFDWLPEWAR